MIVWTEGRAVVLELRPGTETRIPLSRVPQVVEVLGIGSIRRRRASAEGRALRIPAELLQGSASHARLATPQPKKRRPR